MILVRRLFFILNRLWNGLWAKTITIGVGELFYLQHTNDYFLRYDAIVRLLAIENYYQLNNFGFDLYKRMQCARLGIEDSNQYVVRFKALIKSYECEGYKKTSKILLDNDYSIIDGSHRFAMALFYKQSSIAAKVFKNSKRTFYGLDWFKQNGFNEEECLIIEKKYLYICRNYERYTT